MAGSIGPRRLRLKEYGEVLRVSPGVLDYDALVESNSRWKRLLGLKREPFRFSLLPEGDLEIRAEEVTGVVRIGETDIEVVPKFLNAETKNWQSVLWKILTVVEGGYVDEHQTSAHEVDSVTLPDLLAEVFLASYSKGAARGLPRRYRSVPATGPVLRGTLDQARLGAWMVRPWRVPYVSDLFSDDTQLAQLLRWSADRLAQVVAGQGRARALREIASSLSHVGRRPPHPIDAQRIQLGAQHHGLEQALAVGLMMLGGSGVQHARGEFSLSGFLWKSDTIYENFVYWLCSQAIARSGGEVSKKKSSFGELLTPGGSDLETTPDVVFRNTKNRVIAVTDSKYKNFGTRPTASDTYQVLTAAHVLGCKRVSLTYPVGNEKKATVWRVASALGGRNIELTALPLNLMRLTERGGVDELIGVFSDWLEGKHFKNNSGSVMNGGEEFVLHR